MATSLPGLRRIGALSLTVLVLATGSSGPSRAAASQANAPPADTTSAARADARVQRQAFLMGTRVTLAAVAVDRPAGLRILDRLLAGLEAAEAELSTWRPDSLLSGVNRQPVGEPLRAPEQLCDLLDELAGWHRATGGAFDPAVGSLIHAWGLRDGGRVPSPEQLDRALRRAGMDHLSIARRPCRITRLGETTLDAGAFGKGAAIDRLVGQDDALRESTWMVDLGGQVAVHGAGEPWPVALAHPTDRDRPVVELRLRSGSLATSGGSVRDLRVDDRRIGHVVDPRTGGTIARDASVTVWRPRALEADVLSTALYVMGVEDGLAWAGSRGIAACFLLPDEAGEAVALRPTRAFRERFLRAAGPASVPR